MLTLLLNNLLRLAIECVGLRSRMDFTLTRIEASLGVSALKVGAKGYAIGAAGQAITA